MANILADAAAHLVDALKSHASATVKYRRASGGQATLVAIRDSIVRTDTDQNGFVATLRSDDWLVAVSDFRTAFGATAKPVRGDEIDYQEGGITKAFRVMPIAGEPEAMFESQSAVIWRIHSKQVQ